MQNRPNWPDAIARFASAVSREAVLRVSDLLIEERALDAQTVLSADAARLFSEMIYCWQHEMPAVPLSQLGHALLAASATSQTERARQQLEIVWSGPGLISSALRSTGPALLELISSARESIYLLTFAAYKVQAVAEALASAEKRGVRLVFVAESSEDDGGKVDFDPMLHLRSAGLQRAEYYIWPVENRLRDERGRYGSLHAKCAVADHSKLLVSSANLTDFAFNLNIELGLLVTGGHGPLEVAQLVEKLIQSGCLQRRG